MLKAWFVLTRRYIFYWADTVKISCLAKGKEYSVFQQTLSIKCTLAVIAMTLVLQQKREKLATS